MKLALPLFLALASFSAAAGDFVPGMYKIDPAHTRVAFLIEHMTISMVQGRFNDVQGSFSIDKDITKCAVDVTVAIKSVDTGVKKRDDHLRSPDFFDAKKFPKMTFKAKSCTGTLAGLTVKGDLTIKDVTKEVTLTGKVNGSVKGPQGNTHAGLSAEGMINRKDFNVNYAQMMADGPAVGDEVKIMINAEGVMTK